jgi:hypothetical protein
MKHLALRMILAAIPLAPALAFGADANRSGAGEFAERFADSYASYADTNAQRVNPKWGDLKPTDYGTRPVAFNTNGLRFPRPAPAAGVHPRVLFSPGDLPEIRRRLKETQCGREAWKNIISWTEMMKGRYDSQADYAQPDRHHGSHGGLRGRVPLFRLGVPRGPGNGYDASTNAAAIYASLVSGTATNVGPYYWSAFSLEAFRCVIEDDAASAKTLARAVTTALRLAQQKRTADRAALQAKKPNEPLPPISMPIDGVTSGVQFALTYDLLHRWLDPAQRREWHAELAATTWSHDNYGTFNDAHASRSNWASFSYWLFQVLAIEGEPGFNELKVRGIHRGWRNLFTYGWFESGATYEGEAKDQLGMDGVLALARRIPGYGFDPIAAHPHLRAYATRFLPHSVNPMRTGFHQYDLLGGSRIPGSGQLISDALGLKFSYPNDPVVDWVLRIALGKDFENVPTRPDGYYNNLLFTAVYAADPNPAHSDPARLGLGHTFFCGERALLMTRSSWDTNALMLNLHVRQANGGHPFPDRNAIALSGAGRVWSPIPYASFHSAENSLVSINGRTQTEYAPGRMVDFADMTNATFATGDAAYAWQWDWKTLDIPRGLITTNLVREGRIQPPAGWEFEPHSINDFAFTKREYDYLRTPRAEAPHWLQVAGALRPVIRKAAVPVRRAFRTAGLVRGAHPYALVLDDIQLDDSPQRYDWTLLLERDVQIASVSTPAAGITDILLTGDDPGQTNAPASTAVAESRDPASPIPAKHPVLLVRVLHAVGMGTPSIVELPSTDQPLKYPRVRRLVLPANTVSPDFKVLLFPHRHGDPLPATTWNAARSGITIAFPGQADELTFTPDAAGRTRLNIRRGDLELMRLQRDIPALP